MILLLAIGPATIRVGVSRLMEVLLGTNTSRFIAELPIIRMYSELWPMYLVFVVLFVAIIYFEFKQEIIPDAITMPGIAIGIGFVAGFQFVSLIDALLGVVAAFAGLGALNAYWLRTRRRAAMGQAM